MLAAGHAHADGLLPRGVQRIEPVAERLRVALLLVRSAAAHLAEDSRPEVRVHLRHPVELVLMDPDADREHPARGRAADEVEQLVHLPPGAPLQPLQHLNRRRAAHTPAVHAEHAHAPPRRRPVPYRLLNQPVLAEDGQRSARHPLNLRVRGRGGSPRLDRRAPSRVSRLRRALHRRAGPGRRRGWRGGQRQGGEQRPGVLGHHAPVRGVERQVAHSLQRVDLHRVRAALAGEPDQPVQQRFAKDFPRDPIAGERQRAEDLQPAYLHRRFGVAEHGEDPLRRLCVHELSRQLRVRPKRRERGGSLPHDEHVGAEHHRQELLQAPLRVAYRLAVGALLPRDQRDRLGQQRVLAAALAEHEAEEHGVRPLVPRAAERRGQGGRDVLARHLHLAHVPIRGYANVEQRQRPQLVRMVHLR